MRIHQGGDQLLSRNIALLRGVGWQKFFNPELVSLAQRWLFAVVPSGAEASALIYTMVEMARANGVNVYQHTLPTFRKMSDQPDLRRGTGEVGSLGSGSKADHRGTERGSSGGVESASYVSCHNALAASRSGWGLFTTGRSENGVNIY